MSFLDDLEQYGLPLLGTGVGAFWGPGGAALGAGLGGKLGSILTAGNTDAESDMLDKYAGAWDPRTNPDFAAALSQLKDWSSGKVMPQDTQRMLEALDTANQFAKGQTGAIEAGARARGGPNVGLEAALEAESAQGTTQGLSRASSATAAMAAQRGVEANLELRNQLDKLSTMQQQFAMLKSGMAGSQQAARTANANSLFGDLANAGIAAMMRAKNPGGQPNTAAPISAGGKQPVANPGEGSWDPTGDTNVYGNRNFYGGGEYTPSTGRQPVNPDDYTLPNGMRRVQGPGGFLSQINYE